MSRVQLSINVSDFDAAVAFYSRLFGVAPAKVRPGYANFAIDDPPLKLVLNSPGNGPGGTINHLGVEVGSTGEVTQADARPDCRRPGYRAGARRNLLLCAAGQGVGARPGRDGLGVLHRPGAHRVAMIFLLPSACVLSLLRAMCLLSLVRARALIQ
jgi:catechol 2,3-dioxygenase-like lactoylglutathione lyase family enzyme